MWYNFAHLPWPQGLAGPPGERGPLQQHVRHEWVGTLSETSDDMNDQRDHHLLQEGYELWLSLSSESIACCTSQAPPRPAASSDPTTQPMLVPTPAILLVHTTKPPRPTPAPASGPLSMPALMLWHQAMWHRLRVSWLVRKDAECYDSHIQFTHTIHNSHFSVL